WQLRAVRRTAQARSRHIVSPVSALVVTSDVDPEATLLQQIGAACPGHGEYVRLHLSLAQQLVEGLPDTPVDLVVVGIREPFGDDLDLPPQRGLDVTQVGHAIMPAHAHASSRLVPTTVVSTSRGSLTWADAAEVTRTWL